MYRYVGNRLTTILENWLLGTSFSEMHSGLKAYRREVLTRLPLTSYSDDFVFDTQIITDALANGFRIAEIPVPTRYTKESSSVSIGRSIEYIFSSLLVCWRVRGRLRS